MKRLLYILLLALTIIISPKPVVAQTENKNLVVNLTKPGQPGSLKVDLMQGSIKVSAHSGKDVIIGYATRGDDDNDRRRERNSDASANGLRRIPNNNIGLEATEDNNRVVVRTSSFNREIDLAIKVPRDFSLKLSAMNNGKIIVEGVNGELEISNLNDDIRLTDVSGAVEPFIQLHAFTAPHFHHFFFFIAFIKIHFKVAVNFAVIRFHFGGKLGRSG